MMPRACSRAAATILSTSTFAVARELWPFSAAAKPSAISVWRRSIVPRTSGQTNFMQNQTNTNIAIDWPIRVRLISTRILRVRDYARRPGALGGADLIDQRHGDREQHVQRDADADDRDGVEQRDHEEHLRPKHVRKLGLARRALEPAAAEQSHSDTDAERAETHEDRHAENRQTNHSFHQCLQSKSLAF